MSSRLQKNERNDEYGSTVASCNMMSEVANETVDDMKMRDDVYLVYNLGLYSITE